MKDDMRHDWGAFYISSKETGLRAAITNAVLRVEIDVASAEGLIDASERVNAEIYRWYVLLRDWLEVLSHLDLDHEHDLPHFAGRSPVETPSWVAVPRPKDSPAHVYDRHPGMLRVDNDHYITKPQWLHATRMTNRGIAPAEPQLLLRDARNANRRQLARRCILDCATAVEVSVSQRLDAVVDSKVGLAAREKLMPFRVGVTQRIEILRAMGGSIPTDVKTSIFDVRNRVIHKGYRPTIDESRAALAVATRTVMEYSPLDHVRQL